MTFEKHNRPFTPAEARALKKIRSTAEKDINRGYRIQYVFLAIGISVMSAYIATWTSYGVLTFIFGTISVISFFLIFQWPYERYQDMKRAKRKIKDIDALLSHEGVEVAAVKAKRIAIAKEYEDEGDLYIIETASNHVLYLWDSAYNFKGGFPCLDFEIYPQNFFDLVGRQVNPLGEKIKPIVIDAKTKWAYMAKAGSPEHMTVEKRSFDKVLKEINSAALRSKK